MKTTTVTPLSAAGLLPAKVSTDALDMPPRPTALPTVSTQRGEADQPYWGDRVALLIWLACFVLMGVVLLSDLIVSLFR